MEILKEISILYVEDDKEVADALGRSLKRMLKNVYIGYNGKEGVQLYEAHKDQIDMIVTDIKMPVMDGIEMIKEIRKADPVIPIMITSAHGESSFLYDAVDEGVTSYILKPISKKRLKETLAFNAKAIKYDELETKSAASIDTLLQLPNKPALLLKHHHIVRANNKLLNLLGCQNSSELQEYEEKIIRGLVDNHVELGEEEYKLCARNINGSMILIIFE